MPESESLVVKNHGESLNVAAYDGSLRSIILLEAKPRCEIGMVMHDRYQCHEKQ
jgi:hypothetical protein